MKASVKGAAKEVIERAKRPGELKQYTLFTNLGLGRTQSTTTRNGRLLKEERDSLRSAILDGLPETEHVEVEIIDAGFLQAAVNRHRAIRETYFASPVFQSWHENWQLLEKQKHGETLLPMVGRKKQLDELKEMLSDPDVAFIGISGASGMGKSRLLLEACTEIASETFFVRNTAKTSMMAADLKSYASGQQVLIVVEDLRQEEAKAFAEQAILTAGLRIVATIPAEEHLPQLNLGEMPQIKSLRVLPLTYNDARELLKVAQTKLSNNDIDWAIQEAGGNPQILLVASELGSPLRVHQTTLKQRVAAKFVQRSEALFGPPVISALELLSCLSPFPTNRSEPVVALKSCLTLSADLGTLRHYRDRLADAGFLEVSGRDRNDVSVSPPLLATFLLERLIGDDSARVLKIYQALDDDGKKRLIERLISVDSSAGEGLWNYVFGPTGPFAAAGAIEMEIDALLDLVRAAPRQTAMFLVKRADELLGLVEQSKHKAGEGLAGLLSPELTAHQHNQKIDGIRSRIRGLLHGLAYHGDSGEIVFPLLERFAVADHADQLGGNFKKLFLECFTPWYYSFPVPPSERWCTVQRLLKDSSKEVRSLGVEAIFIISDPPHSLSGQTVQNWRISDAPRTLQWKEVFEHRELGFSAHFKLALKSGPHREQALKRLGGAIHELQHLPPERGIKFHRLIVGSFFKDRLKLDPSDVLSGLWREKKRLVEYLEKHSAEKWVEQIPPILKEVHGMMDKFFRGSILLRLQIWIDEGSMYGWDEDPKTGRRRYEDEIKGIARELVEKPALLIPKLRKAMAASKKYHATQLAYEIGILDRKLECWNRMGTFQSSAEDLWLFAAYCNGLKQHALARVQKYLDEMPAGTDEAMLTILRFLGPSKDNRERLQKMIRRKGIKPDVLGWSLCSGNWIHDLPPKEVRIIFLYVESPHTPEAYYSLLQLFSFYLHGKTLMSPLLFGIAERVLTRACDQRQDTDYDRNTVASAYVRSTPVKGVKIFERQLERILKVGWKAYGSIWNPVGGSSGSLDFMRAAVELFPQRVYCATLDYLGSKRRVGHFNDEAVLFDLKKHQEILLKVAKDENRRAILASHLVSTQPHFWEFVFQLIFRFPEDQRMRNALIGLFDESFGWGEHSDRLTTAIKDLEKSKKASDLPPHGALFIAEAIRVLAKRRAELSARTMNG
ncbi:hypothetical protein CMV30_06180 [Nibricoccus aquaticus]|uniref:Uncharacterized protein n=1 Tax=Nibricoccus aquaticus TaxID=2576891 RepID=A0A290Q509_9BACT|nr:hypothetical protein CMV30_06180 [Nibricoccus aquaticus]